VSFESEAETKQFYYNLIENEINIIIMLYLKIQLFFDKSGDVAIYLLPICCITQKKWVKTTDELLSFELWR
jgi:hypothetical protein